MACVYSCFLQNKDHFSNLVTFLIYFLVGFNKEVPHQLKNNNDEPSKQQIIRCFVKSAEWVIQWGWGVFIYIYPPLNCSAFLSHHPGLSKAGNSSKNVQNVNSLLLSRRMAAQACLLITGLQLPNSLSMIKCSRRRKKNYHPSTIQKPIRIWHTLP